MEKLACWGLSCSFCVWIPEQIMVFNHTDEEILQIQSSTASKQSARRFASFSAVTRHIRGMERGHRGLSASLTLYRLADRPTLVRSIVANNYCSCCSVTECWGRSFFHMSASGGSLLAKELHSQAVTVANLAWHQADLQYPPSLSTDWLEVIDLEQCRHLLKCTNPSIKPPPTLLYKVGLYILISMPPVENKYGET